MTNDPEPQFPVYTKQRWLVDHERKDTGHHLRLSVEQDKNTRITATLSIWTKTGKCLKKLTIRQNEIHHVYFALESVSVAASI